MKPITSNYQQSEKIMEQSINNEKYADIVRRYKARFGELPQDLYNAGPALPLYLELMEQALQGKRGPVSEADLGYLPGQEL